MIGYALWCLKIVRQSFAITLCYQVIGLVVITNLFGLINHVLIEFLNPSDLAIALETVCVYIVNYSSLINILFVKRQWITTRKQFFRQAVTVECKKMYLR